MRHEKRSEKMGQQRFGANACCCAAVMQAAHLNLDEAADAREKSSRVVIEPAQRKEYDRFSVSLCSQRTASLGFEEFSDE